MRIIIILLSGLMLAGSMTACGKKGNPVRPSEINKTEQAAS